MARRKRQVVPTSRPFHFPAPMGGLNTVASGTAMPITDCVQVWNLIASENGLRARLGYREHSTGLTGASDNKVRTLLSFSGSTPANNRLFATTSTKIYDVTASDDSPETDVTFSDSAGSAGYGVGRVMVTPAGHFFVYTDEENGLQLYTESGSTWSAPTMGVGAGQIANVDPASFVHVTVFKQRLWFTEKNSTRAWYLPVSSVAGAASSFDFGQQFKAGGHLVGLWNWSYDGGAGMDDSLVAISSAGDVVIVNGTDPDDPTTIAVRGVWNMGPPPVGRNIAKDVGGDLYLLSSLGILPISRLVVGAENREYTTAKVGNLFNNLMLTRADSLGWSMHLHPEDNALVVLYPDYSTETSQQLVMAQANRAWFRYRDVPMHCAEVWEGKLYFGTEDGRVCAAAGYLDNVSLEPGESSGPVEWSLLTSFQRVGGGAQAQVHQTRSLFVVDGGRPSFSVEARYDYTQTEASEPEEEPSTSGTWGNGLWGQALWGGRRKPYSVLRGVTGSGHEVAIAMRGKANARTTLVGVELLLETGGWL